MVAVDGEVDVEYEYLPNDVTIDEDCEISTKVSSKTLALAVVSEYCMIEGLYEQSVMFGQKFQEEIKLALTTNRSVYLKARRWI